MTMQDFIAEAGLSIEASSIPFRSDSLSEWDEKACHFAVTVRKGSSVIWRGNYSVGSAHPLMWAKKRGRMALDVREADRYAKTLAGSQAAERIRKAYMAAAPLDLGDVLGSLRIDAGVTDAGSFEDWAGDMGFDPDSRKAEAIYNACCKTAAELRVGLGRDLFAKFLAVEEE